MKIGLLCVAMLLCGTLWAAPMDIKSDKLIVEHGKQRAEFIGSVSVTQDDLILHCDRMLAFYDEQRGDEIKRLEAFGHVRMQQGERRASADRAVYERRTSLVTLTGHAEILDGGNLLRGERIEYNLQTTDTRVFKSDDGERVHLVIESKDVSDQAQP